MTDLYPDPHMAQERDMENEAMEAEYQRNSRPDSLSSLSADQLAKKVVAAWEETHAGRPLAERVAPPGTSDALAELVRRLKAAEDALDAAMHELGVPDDDYPAPVANAYTILLDALAAIRPNPEQPKPERCEDAVTPNSPFGI